MYGMVLILISCNIKSQYVLLLQDLVLAYLATRLKRFGASSGHMGELSGAGQLVLQVLPQRDDNDLFRRPGADIGVDADDIDIHDFPDESLKIAF